LRLVSSQPDPNLLDIPLIPALSKLQDLIQRIKLQLTLQTREIGPLQGHLPHQGTVRETSPLA
jgi:hypothetical protein